MAQMMQETDVAPDDARFSLEARHERLQTLVGELLQTNEELRFKSCFISSRRLNAEARSLDEASADLRPADALIAGPYTERRHEQVPTCR